MAARLELEIGPFVPTQPLNPAGRTKSQAPGLGVPPVYKL